MLTADLTNVVVDDVFEQEVGFALDALMHQQPSEMLYSWRGVVSPDKIMVIPEHICVHGGSVNSSGV
jgi:hypothetical protein